MKKILITGSTDGIGKLTALKLAKQGHQVLLHGRNKEKLAGVIKELKNDSGNEHVSGYAADLSDLQQVEILASNIANDHDQLDVLINNAGVFLSSSPIHSSGKDIRFLVNYYAPVMLTDKLLPTLKKGADGRVINLSSAAQSSISLEALRGEKTLSDQEAYAQSKLAILMWSFHLAEREKELLIIPVNPGSLLNTKMVQEAYGKHWSSADKGADILCSLALDKEHSERSGQYFDNDRGDYGPAHEDAYDETIVSRLMDITNSLIAKPVKG